MENLSIYHCPQDTDSINEIYLQMKTEAYPPEGGDRIKGRAFSDLKKFTVEIEEVITKYFKKKLTKVQCENMLKEKLEAVKLDNKSKETEIKRNKRIDLASFSPWLADGYEGEVEIPGQYTGESRPLPQQHVTIVGFKRHVQSQNSLRAPVQVTVLGNDAKDHRLLVKFGEDLRQDQRIQQLFVLMNHLLREDAAASRSGLSVDTYMVSPLNSRLGVIEWVDKTIPLRHFMVRGKELEDKNEEAVDMYREWFNQCNVSVFFNTVKREQSITIYNRVMNHLPKFMLRDAVWQLAASPEAFVHLRTQMLTSHACLSICHWLLGIGDRHLSNTLVRLDTGRFLGIDFGHAFGTATFLIGIPELLPIRLTPQITNLAAPLGETGKYDLMLSLKNYSLSLSSWYDCLF
ncbi:hypothetical protein J6590_071022 [Homalodisca vitripennis]|nr:hypothetical protein J6590_071022 [Homalodisca vitripennis]